MKAYIYQIEAISNLHAGSGEANEGVIDNLIQRDSVTGLPIVNASSLKGALREHFKGQKTELIEYIFGSEANDKERREAGAYRFFDARLLAIPVRSDKAPYLMATSPLVLKDYLRNLELFGLPMDKDLKQPAQQTPDTPRVANLTYDKARIEDLEKTAACKEPLKGLSTWFGNASVLLPDTDFRTLCDNDHLPVFAPLVRAGAAAFQPIVLHGAGARRGSPIQKLQCTHHPELGTNRCQCHRGLRLLPIDEYF